MRPTYATAYDQNPARMNLVLKTRRKQERKKSPKMIRLLVTLGIVALYAANHFPG